MTLCHFLSSLCFLLAFKIQASGKESLYWLFTRLVSPLPFWSQHWCESVPTTLFHLALSFLVHFLTLPTEYFSLGFSKISMIAHCSKLWRIYVFTLMCLLCMTFSIYGTTVSAHKKWTGLNLIVKYVISYCQRCIHLIISLKYTCVHTHIYIYIFFQTPHP